MNRIFDSHAHYDDEKFSTDVEAVLQKIQQSGVERVVNAASDIPSSYRGLELAEKHSFLYSAAGVHPHEAEDVQEDYLKVIEKLTEHPKVVAVGEIGLDYHYDFSPRDIQKRVFEEQLILANRLDMPVIIHSREALADTMELVKKHRPKGVIHCFSGSAETAREYGKLGLYIGFTGVVTFSNARKTLEAAATVPLDRLLIETDCPYMAPVPYRGQRCDSSMLPRTAEALAAVRQIDPQKLCEITYTNACTLFGIKE